MDAELKAAIKTLMHETRDYAYAIKEDEGGWEGPRMKAWERARKVIKKHLPDAAE